MVRVLQTARSLAAYNAAVLITGETGSGKEVVAQTIHRFSSRSSRPWIDVNCAALPEHLVESELFGHEKGAFTGAVAAKQGLIEVAEGGTLFIDEISETAPGLQAKLLRVLEDGRYRRVGGTQEARADVRVIAATNKDLEEEQRAGRFREDLYYRLNVVAVKLPPLRERPEDIPELVRHFLATRRVGTQPFRLQPEALEALRRYDWPGNVRELANVLERAQILAEDSVVTLDDLPENIVEVMQPASSPAGNPHHLCETKRRHVREVLRAEKGNKVHAARALGISRRALYRLIRKYGLGEV